MKPTAASPQAARGSATLPLLALAVGAFGIGTTEFSPMGLLPVIADGVHVSIPTAGMLISAYAIGVMAGALIAAAGLAFVVLQVARQRRAQVDANA
jgi:DHA1 family inner membrane transport protein